jgi:endonuclease-3
MANDRQGPRQPLSQRRPKVASGKSSSVSSRPSGKLKQVTPARGSAERRSKPRPAAAPKKMSRTTNGRRFPPANPGMIYERLHALYPDAHCELDFKAPFQLVVATILSAQCTDKRVNMVTPVLFTRYPTVESLARAKQEDVEEIIKSTGFFRNKAKSIIGMAGAVADRHGGTVPSTLDELVKLPGVGRKTANVVLGNAFDINDGVVVDTHVGRLSNRLGLTSETDPIKVEQILMSQFERPNWTMLAHLLIFHGRRVCDAKKPKCGVCTLADICPSSQV